MVHLVSVIIDGEDCWLIAYLLSALSSVKGSLSVGWLMHRRMGA
jgi:hypothetical protein